MMFKKFLSVLLLLCTILPVQAEEWLVDDNAVHMVPDALEQARYLMRDMTIEEKAGMLLMVSPEDLTGEKRTERILDSACFDQLPAGGIIIYGQNISSAQQLKALTEEITLFSKQSGLYPPFIAVDEEGGQVIRVANKLGIEAAPSAEAIGLDGNTNNAYEAGRHTGAYLYDLGINLDLAPVADVLIENAPELETRTYGTDPLIVADMAVQMAKGLHDSHIISCYKHFPGHGTITRNTHTVPTGHSRTLQQMQAAELIPFQKAIENDADMIMISHLKARQLDPDRPASLSPNVINGVLRQAMGYEGVVITDAFRMGAITQDYSQGEAAVLSILAGADIVLVPGSGKDCYRSILTAIKNGRISPQRLDQSVERILALKIKSGLIQ